MQFGGAPVAGRMSNPTLQMANANGMIIAENDDWQSTQSLEIAPTGLAPEKAEEPAILTVLPPGPVTFLLRGTNNTTGIALLEMFRLGD